ncbi:MAG: hypothetical protein ACR2NS_16300 [Gemmatimonadaceae bacterium]
MTIDANTVIKDWPEDSRTVTAALITKYGPADEVTPTLITWLNRGPWKKIVASKEATPHNFPFPHGDIVENFTEYKVPSENLSKLAQFDGSVTVSRTRGLLSARCHDEEANHLAVNLAHDIIKGKATVAQARQTYVDTMLAFREHKPTPYMRELQFKPQPNAADPDIALVSTDQLKKAAKEHKTTIPVGVESRP